jgi:hypothetical protein
LNEEKLNFVLMDEDINTYEIIGSGQAKIIDIYNEQKPVILKNH